MRVIKGGGASADRAKSGGAYSTLSATILPGILENSDDPFAAFNPDMRLVAFNAAFRQWLGDIFDSTPRLNESLQAAMSKFHKSYSSIVELCRRSFAGEAFRVVQEFTEEHGESKGHLYYFEVSLSPVMDTEGKPVVVALVLHDITENRLVEQKYRAILEATPDAMLVVRRGIIEFASSKAETMFRYPHEALAGERIEVLLPERFRQSHVFNRETFEKHPPATPNGNRTRSHGFAG